MATGDSKLTARAIVREIEVDDWRAKLRPEDKSGLVAELRARGHRVAMAGDGINDAPALASADVGIAMGTGADVAVESAGITLVRGDIAAIVRAVRLARVTSSNIRQNLLFAFAYNVVGVAIAAGALYPATGLLLSPMLAAAAMSLSSVSVIGNALRLRRTPSRSFAVTLRRERVCRQPPSAKDLRGDVPGTQTCPIPARASAPAPETARIRR